MRWVCSSLLMLVVLWSGAASAARYQWYVGSTSSGLYDSPIQACQGYVDRVSQPPGTPNTNHMRNPYVTTYTELQFRCHFESMRSYGDGSNTGTYYTDSNFVTRVGDSCDEGTIYNPETGACETDCADTVGESLLVRGDDAVVINSNGTNYVASQAPESICSLSCSYAPVSNFSASCYLVAGSTSTGYCNYIVEGTGDSCSGSNLVAGDSSGDPLNPVDPGDGGEPDPCHGVPGYEWDGSTCVKTDGDGGGDGSGDGGDGSGDGDGDGSGDGDGGDGGSGGDGGGSGDGDGDGSGGGGGSGDGGCTGEDCGEGEGGGLNRPEKGNFEEAIAEYDQKITDTLAEIKDQSGQFGSLIEQKMAIPLNSGNAVLPCFEADIAGRTVGFCLSDNADQLAILRNILLFLATVIALFIIFREDK